MYKFFLINFYLYLKFYLDPYLLILLEYWFKASIKCFFLKSGHKTSVKNIKTWNGIRGSKIKINQKLEIRVIAKDYAKHDRSNKKKIYYTVKYGDTLSEIADRYGIGLTKLKKWNRIKSEDKIVVGQKLLIWAPI